MPGRKRQNKLTAPVCSRRRFFEVFQDTGKPAGISKIQIYKNLYGGYIPLILKIITPIIIIVKIWGNVL